MTKNKIRVHKDNDWARHMGYTESVPEVARPWVCGATPEDRRKSYWPTWSEALSWATEPERREAEMRMEGSEY